jgi:hypothetical protein
MELAESKVFHRKAVNMVGVARLVGLDTACSRQDSALHQFAVTERRE